jgi:hypothetical protein
MLAATKAGVCAIANTFLLLTETPGEVILLIE